VRQAVLVVLASAFWRTLLTHRHGSVSVMFNGTKNNVFFSKLTMSPQTVRVYVA